MARTFIKSAGVIHLLKEGWEIFSVLKENYGNKKLLYSARWYKIENDSIGGSHRIHHSTIQSLQKQKVIDSKYNLIKPMKTIDTCIQEFLATLQHTPGPWTAGHTPFYLRMGQKGNPSTIRSPHHTEEIATIWTCMLPAGANACLISSSPLMLKTICYTYLTLLHKFAYGQNSTCNEVRISLDDTLASLRNSISVATGLECEYVQTVFEQYVKEIAN